MRAYITTWLKISEHNKAFSKRDTQAISVADLLWLIYIFVYNICTCARLSDPPREVSPTLSYGVPYGYNSFFFFWGRKTKLQNENATHHVRSVLS